MTPTISTTESDRQPRTAPASYGPDAADPPTWIGADFRALLVYAVRLLKVCAVYALVSTPLLLGYYGVLRTVGECPTTGQLARLSRGASFLWHSAYFHGGNLRPSVAAELQPRLAVIGSSRVMQFRRPMFALLGDQDFYVAGMSGNFTLPCLTTLRRLTRAAHKPELVLLGLDYWWFETALPPEAQRKEKLVRWIGCERYRHLREVRYEADEWSEFLLDQLQLAQQAWRDPRLYAALRASAVESESGRRLLGVQARLTGEGYRNDGSYRYTGQLPCGTSSGPTAEVQAADWIAASAAKTGNHDNEAAFDDLQEFVVECRRTGVRLIVFLPPIYPDALNYLRCHPDMCEFWKRFPGRVGSICRSATVPFHDFSDPSHLLAPDGNFLDWFHGSERLYGRLVLEMCQDPDTWALLSRYVDRPGLRQAVEAAGDPFLMFGD